MTTSPPRRPPYRDRRASWRDASFASLDFETTGLDYRRDDIVSFGVVPVQGGRVVLRDAIHRLVAPTVPVSPTSVRIHQLLPAELASAPDLSGSRAPLAQALAGRFMIAWFADLEIAFLGRTFGNARRSWRARTVDVRSLALAVEGLAPDSHLTLTSAAERFGVPVSAPHDAFDDALVAAQLFLILASRFERAGGGRVVDLIRVSRGASRTRALERRLRPAV
jgi:DNA polymerase III subunit epsilon